MNTKERIEALKAKHPDLFKDGGPRSGFYVGEGWMPILEKLFSLVDHHLKWTVPEEVKGAIYVAQVKEKFGTLTVYWNASTPYIDGATSMAELVSGNTCEECGLPGARVMGGWLKTLCKKHAKKQAELKKNILKNAVKK